MDVTPRVHVLSLGFCAASAFLSLPYSSAVVIMYDSHVFKVTTPPSGASPSNIYCRPKYKSRTDDRTGGGGGLTSVTTLSLLLLIPRTETPHQEPQTVRKTQTFSDLWSISDSVRGRLPLGLDVFVWRSATSDGCLA